ncbi:hypothetical protein CYMTET_20651 [Cymbomonas tetramitiformis]|uniref:Uncharacterized protein n=1 Tax=Cymbomonas tetramitiformis TaxID=36881 RepID=A0AAE0L3N9_9CHLO|nr:hypothetical protein CYMTET_20651 [Cymbomonas tetramitiformis]
MVVVTRDTATFYGDGCVNAVVITISTNTETSDAESMRDVVRICETDIVRCCVERLALSTTSACVSATDPILGTTATPTAMPTLMLTAVPTIDDYVACSADYAFVANRTNLYYANRLHAIRGQLHYGHRHHTPVLFGDFLEVYRHVVDVSRLFLDLTKEISGESVMRHAVSRVEGQQGFCDFRAGAVL